MVILHYLGNNDKKKSLYMVNTVTTIIGLHSTCQKHNFFPPRIFLIHGFWLCRCGTYRYGGPIVFPEATQGKPISGPIAGLISQFSVSWKHIFVHSFLFGSVTVLSSGLSSFQLQIPSLLRRWEGKHSFAIYGVQEGLFTLLTISTVVTPWHPKNVPGPL